MTFHPDQLRPPERARFGAHRPRRSPLLEVLPAVLVLLAVAGVGVGVWQLDRSTASTVAASGGPADSARAGEDATTRPSPTRGGASTATASGTSTQTAAPTSGTVDRAIRLSVLNATARSGLAARAARALRAAGWSVRTGNQRGQPPPTTVFYADNGQQTTAEAVADDLGGSPVVEQSSQFGDRITVVLGDDYVG